ncbi:MAG: ABC transporter ATP-binding protein [Anaerolineae bacterium]|jgi:energy-coupling factor transporter ATP-binding protein EcfA2|nr:energy-coupling factor ABC transporter ATP-binding protein [Chloroflexota bacterium]
MISLQDVTYRYPDALSPALNHIDLNLEAGSFTLVSGVSGSGKTTLLRLLNGLVPHFSGGVFSGTIRVAGLDPVREGPGRMSRRVGVVFQDPESQFVVDSVEAELALAMEHQGLSRTEMGVRITQVLRQLEIVPLRQRRIGTLSGGEKQRVALAAALTLQPQVLVLDEPTSQLDPQSAAQVLDALARLNHELGITVVLSEHRLERILPFIDQLIFLPGDGTLRQGTPRQLLAEVDLSSPLVTLAKCQGWSPIPLSVEEARRWVPSREPEPSVSVRTVQPKAIDSEPAEMSIQGLAYTYGENRALSDLSLQIHRGEMVALMGPNGSGKTTLLKLLAGLLKPSAGKVYLRGRDTQRLDLEEVIQTVGLVPQNPNALLFADTVAEELAFTRQSHGMDSGCPAGLLETLGISRLLTTYPRDLSVGERQRVALAAILVAEPEIILLDEPTRGVDWAQKEAFMAYLASERAHGHTVLFATHDVELVAQCADRIVLLEGGRCVADGAVREVMFAWPQYCSQIGRLYRDGHTLTPQDVREASR